MPNGPMMLAIAEAKADAAEVEGLENRLRAAMQCTMGHWLVTTEDERFRCAIGAVMALAHDEEDHETYDRLEHEIKQLGALAAMLSGVPVDVERMAKMVEEHPPIGAMKMWRELKEEQKE